MKLRYSVIFSLFLFFSNCTHTRWQANYHTGHPLVGKILDTRTAELKESSRLGDLIISAHPQLVLLGEAHDHPDHHRIHSEILEQLKFKKRLGTLFLEHLNIDQNQTLDKLLSMPNPFADLQEKLGWSEGWDDFKFYEPMLKAAWDAKQQIKGVNISRKDLKALVKGENVESVSSKELARIHKLPHLSESLKQALAAEIVSAHCNMFAEKHASPIVEAQVMRDKIMSYFLIESLVPGKISTFIGGNSHMRRDRGVPYYLKAYKPDLKLLSIGFIQVDPNKQDPKLYGDLPYDLILFTPVFDPADPCEKFRKSLETMKKAS